MKKIMAVFVVALGLLMAQGVSASTLAWVNVPVAANAGDKVQTSGDLTDTIGGDYYFGKAASGVNHSWKFNLTPASNVTSEFSVTVRGGTFTSAKLDGVTITTLTTVLLNAGTHTLEILGIKAFKGTHESVTIYAANAVPVPGAVWLLGSALMGLVGVSRRKTAAKGLAA